MNDKNLENISRKSISYGISTPKLFTIVFSVFLLILLLNIHPVHAQQLELNTGSNNTLTANLSVFINKINLDDKIIDLQISPDASGNNDYKLGVNVPHALNSIYNFTKDTNGWYHIFMYQSTIQLPETPLESDYLFNPWPFDTYHVDVFVEVNKNVTLEYQAQQDTGFAQGLVYNKDWEVIVTPKLNSTSNIQDSNYLPFKSSVFNYQIILSHTPSYKIKSVVYWIASLIVPILLVIGHFLFVRKKELSIQAALFTGIVIIFITGIFTIRSILPPDLTVIETALLCSTIVYAIGFFIILCKRRKLPN